MCVYVYMYMRAHAIITWHLFRETGHGNAENNVQRSEDYKSQPPGTYPTRMGVSDRESGVRVEEV